MADTPGHEADDIERIEALENKLKGIEDILQGLNPRNLAGLSSKQIVGAAETVGNVEITGSLIHTGATVGFYSTTPTAQHAAIGALTDSTGGTADSTVEATNNITAINGSGATTTQEGDINTNFATVDNNFADIITKLNKLEETVRLVGLSG